MSTNVKQLAALTKLGMFLDSIKESFDHEVWFFSRQNTHFSRQKLHFLDFEVKNLGNPVFFTILRNYFKYLGQVHNTNFGITQFFPIVRAHRIEFWKKLINSLISLHYPWLELIFAS